MNMLQKTLVLIFTLFFMAGGLAQAATQNEYWKELQSLPFPENYPTKETCRPTCTTKCSSNAPAQVVLWSLPATALWAMKKGSEAEFGEGSNVFPDLERPLERRNHRQYARTRM